MRPLSAQRIRSRGDPARRIASENQARRVLPDFRNARLDPRELQPLHIVRARPWRCREEVYDQPFGLHYSEVTANNACDDPRGSARYTLFYAHAYNGGRRGGIFRMPAAADQFLQRAIKRPDLVPRQLWPTVSNVPAV